MSRRTGNQQGSVFQKGMNSKDKWDSKMVAYGRYWVDDEPDQPQKRVVVSLGVCRTKTEARRLLFEHLQKTGVNDLSKMQERIVDPITSFREQAKWMIAEIKAARILHARKRTPIRTRTIDAYANAVTYLNEVLGDQPLSAIGNAQARALVARMRTEADNGNRRFSDKTIVNYFQVLKKVIASAVNENGDEIHPRIWKLSFICLPAVNPRNQKRGTLTGDEISKIIALSKGRYRILYALLAATGMRISEALAIEIGKHLNEDCSVIRVSQQRSKKGHQIECYTKTEAGKREIDLHPDLAKLLREYIGGRTKGFLFSTKRGRMLSPTSVYRDSLKSALKAIGRDGVRYHAFRRFRESVLLASEARNILIDYWQGHENRDMSTRYGEQLKSDTVFRQSWAAKIPLGFTLPGIWATNGQPVVTASQEEKAA